MAIDMDEANISLRIILNYTFHVTIHFLLLFQFVSWLLDTFNFFGFFSECAAGGNRIIPGHNKVETKLSIHKR